MDPLSPKAVVILKLIEGLLPAMTAAIGGLWVAFTYVENQRHAHKDQINQTERENLTRLIEAQRPFSSIQLALFMEAGKAAAQLAAFDKSKDSWSDSVEWKAAYTRFYQIFWTELSIVEDEPIKHAMENFSAKLSKILAHPRDVSEQNELNQLAYQLARTIRSSIEKTWEVDLGKVGEEKKS